MRSAPLVPDIVRRGTVVKKELKIGDIARIAGLSEEDVRRYTRDHDELFAYRTIGRVKLFSPRAVQTVRELAGLASGQAEEQPRSQPEAAASGGAPAQVYPPEPAEAVVGARVIGDTVAHIQRQLGRLQGEFAGQRESVGRTIEELQESVDLLRRQLEAQQRQIAIIGEWIDYFDAQMDAMNRPLVERIRHRLGTD